MRVREKPGPVPRQKRYDDVPMGRDDSSYETASRAIRSSLAGREPRRLEVGRLRPAAVLVTLLRRGRDARIPFTLRSENLGNHRGEISFPGGRCEPGEDGPRTALREAFEEIALDPARIDVVGCLDDAVSVSGYVVTPVVGLCDNPPETCVADASEVREVFEVSLADLLDPNRSHSEWWDLSRLPPGAPVEDLRRAATDSREFDSSTSRYRMYFFEAAPNRVIWGLTARILKGFLEPLCVNSRS